MYSILLIKEITSVTCLPSWRTYVLIIQGSMVKLLESWHYVIKCSYNINRPAFCHNHLVDDISKVAGIHTGFSATIVWASEICLICKFLYCWNECEFNVEFRGILSGQIWKYWIHFFLFGFYLFFSHKWRLFVFKFYLQIAKLSMIPVSCFLEVVLDHVRYSRDTKLSITVVLLGVAVCTVTDVSVNAKGFLAALVAVWSTALQQYVSILLFGIHYRA